MNFSHDVGLAGPRPLGGARFHGLLGAVALVSLLVLGFGAAKASAAPLLMEFTEGRANVGLQLDDDVLFGTAPFAAQIDAGGLITDGVLQVPQFSKHITDPINADVTVDFDIGEIDGSFNQTTGALSLSGTAAGTLTADDDQQCHVSVPDFLTLTTGGSSGGDNPRFGVPFTKGGLVGAGAIAGTWAHMDADPVIEDDAENIWFCGHVESQIGGPGGVWLEHDGDVVPPAAPQLSGTDPASPSPSGTPRIRGSAEGGANVSVYAGPNCAGAPVATASAAELGSPGIQVSVAEGVTASFSATATDAAGNASPCSAPIAYARVKQPAPPGGDEPKPKPRPACVVPKLAGKTLKRARRALKRANCKLGKVQRPKRRKGKRAKGKRRPVLVVKRSTPRRGARPADRTVDLKLGPKPRKARR